MEEEIRTRCTLSLFLNKGSQERSTLPSCANSALTV